VVVRPPVPARWAKYGPTWHRTPVQCAGCAATSHEPGLFRWAWTRDASGFTVSRCARCAPGTLGRPSDTTFGAAAS
jgi:hypothetical protein